MPSSIFPWFASEQKARRRARALAKSDLLLLEELVRIRHERGMSQDDVAAMLGVSQQAISKFERLGSDPHFSKVRQYAHAIGALVFHSAMPDQGQLEQGEGWVAVNFVAPVTGDLTFSESRLQYAADSARIDFSLAA